MFDFVGLVQVPSNQFTKRMNADRDSSAYENIPVKKTYCDHVCEAIPLVCKNFKMKMLIMERGKPIIT